MATKVSYGGSYAGGGYGGNPGTRISYSQQGSRSGGAAAASKARNRQAQQMAKMLSDRQKQIQQRRMQQDQVAKQAAEQRKKAIELQRKSLQQQALARKKRERQHLAGYYQAEVGKLKEVRFKLGQEGFNPYDSGLAQQGISDQQRMASRMGGSTTATMNALTSNPTMGQYGTRPGDPRPQMYQNKYMQQWNQLYGNNIPNIIEQGPQGPQPPASYPSPGSIPWYIKQGPQGPNRDPMRRMHDTRNYPQFNDNEALYVDDPQLPGLPELPALPGFGGFGSGGGVRGGSSGRLDRWLQGMANWSLLQGF